MCVHRKGNLPCGTDLMFNQPLSKFLQLWWRTGGNNNRATKLKILYSFLPEFNK